MFFNSPTFLYLFLPAVLAGYYVLPGLLRGGGRRHAARNALLFAASVFFYAWGERDFAAVLLASLGANYTLARLIHAEQSRGRSGRRVVVTAVVCNLGLLGYLKYAGFAVRNLSAGWEGLGGTGFSMTEPHLPIGVSFFTFQAISYVIDVYRRDVPADRDFVRFGLYVFLFPHLIAGPIVRYRDLADQLRTRPQELARFADGLRRLVQGLAKKLLLADTLAAAADAAFALPPEHLAASGAWFGAACYALQIYFDFSGYSDMAIGLGKLFGFDFRENFLHPYAADSVTEFWRRWHVSLSTWFRDYVYIPLGGNRAGTGRTYFNLTAVFLLCGLWHGANWTFLTWGLFHGLLLVLERAGLGRILAAAPGPVRHTYTLAAVTFGWVLFRAQTLPQAAGVFAAMLGLSNGTYIAADFATTAVLLAVVVGAVASLPVLAWLDRVAVAGGAWAAAGVRLAGVGAAGVLLFLSEAWLAGQSFASFIYFRF